VPDLRRRNGCRESTPATIQRFPLKGRCEEETSKERNSAIVDDHVLRLGVPMRDSLLVAVTQDAGDRSNEPQSGYQLQSFPLGDELAEVFAVYVAEDCIRQALVLAAVI
jgi:hypothetical protein